MSQQPPPPPYGGPPGGQPPGPYQAPAPAGLSNKARFWIGVALSIPVIVVCGVVSGISVSFVSGVSGNSSAGSVVAAVVSLGQLGLFVAALVVQRTRWYALGVLAGTGLLLILTAGACVLLIAGLSGGLG